MSISKFIENHVHPIVDEWVEFAQLRLPASHRFTHDELADHAKVLLLALAADIQEPQEAQAKHEKSQGNRPDHAPDITRISREHGAQRFNQGFSLDFLVSEFRALRASVIRRWTVQLKQPRHEDLEELTRFGESMDQALSESTSVYAKSVDDSRNLLLGVLGHDLRTPLGVVHLSAQYLLLQADTMAGGQTKAVARILKSTDRMKAMVKDMLDFTQTAFGVTLPITPAPADFEVIAKDIVTEVAALYPDSRIDLTCEGTMAGRWDAARAKQMVANLLANAVQHGTAGAPVNVTVDGTEDGIRVTVSNLGTPIPPEERDNLFSPMRQKPMADGVRKLGSSGLGLGLYIANQIAVAHGGSVAVVSGKEGTNFSVLLPRFPPVTVDRRARANSNSQEQDA